MDILTFRAEFEGPSYVFTFELYCLIICHRNFCRQYVVSHYLITLSMAINETHLYKTKCKTHMSVACNTKNN